MELDARRLREQEALVARGAWEQDIDLQPPVVAFHFAVPDLAAAQDLAWAMSAER